MNLTRQSSSSKIRLQGQAPRRPLAGWAKSDPRRTGHEALFNRPFCCQHRSMQVRSAQARDNDAIWDIIGPTIRAGKTYALPRDMSRAAALSYWNSPGHEVFVADQGAKVLGTY